MIEEFLNKVWLNPLRDKKKGKEHESVEKIDFDKDDDMLKAHALIKAIEEHIGFDDVTGLVKTEVNALYLSTRSNTSLAVAYLLFGRSDDANSILRGIEEHMGFYDKCFVGDGGANNQRLYTENNASLASAYFLSGRSDEANILLETIEKKVGFDDRDNMLLVQGGVRDFGFYTYDNAWLATAYLLADRKDKADPLFKGIEEKIGFKDYWWGKSLVKWGRGAPAFCSSNSACLASAYLLSGRKSDANKLLKGIERKIGFDDEKNLVRRSIDGSALTTYSNACLAMAYLLRSGNANLGGLQR